MENYFYPPLFVSLLCNFQILTKYINPTEIQTVVIFQIDVTMISPSGDDSLKESRSKFKDVYVFVIAVFRCVRETSVRRFCTTYQLEVFAGLDFSLR